MIVRLDEDALDGFFQETFRIPKNDYDRNEWLIIHVFWKEPRHQLFPVTAAVPIIFDLNCAELCSMKSALSILRLN